ncbi:cupin domain-containing protein [Cupriavidus sp. CV2]|uniref:cupin domain-containing protein n=1 Tax=Cupriavidus ulmosensis TaxID=3065913 RepID=UPI00296ADF43|nr:cupin domain-containing protein [Cupriavidus sp. CV2]MDW3687484.1 cupin domain-containing protein [Cupriavidus sp. CV2]
MPAQPDSQNQDKDQLIHRFALRPHPEGGYYRETHRDAARVSREGAGNLAMHAASTAIYYLLCDNAYSAWHRIRSDEVWHFYAGCTLNVHVLEEDGSLTTHRLGNALADDDAVFQAVVKAGCWFAAERSEPDGFSLVGCTVAPGFEFSEFELANADSLLASHPRHAALIARLAPAPQR